MLIFSPDRSENPPCPGFGQGDCNEERDKSFCKCTIFLLLKIIFEIFCKTAR